MRRQAWQSGSAATRREVCDPLRARQRVGRWTVAIVRELGDPGLRNIGFTRIRDRHLQSR
jgi:hypothetical protein